MDEVTPLPALDENITEQPQPSPIEELPDLQNLTSSVDDELVNNSLSVESIDLDDSATVELANSGPGVNIAEELPAQNDDSEFQNRPASQNNSASMSDEKQQTSLSQLSGGLLDIKTIKDIKVHVQAVLGGVSMTVSELSNLKSGELISLERNIGDEIDVLANGQLIARGEIVVIEEDNPKFGITITQITGSKTS